MLKFTTVFFVGSLGEALDNLKRRYRQKIVQQSERQHPYSVAFATSQERCKYFFG